MAAFSTTDEAVLTAPLELDPLAQSATASGSGRSIYDVYDIRSTAARIHRGRFQRVALQFPDEALVDSVPVFWALKRAVRDLYAAKATRAGASSASTSKSGASAPLPELYILADTSYGGCCVDEVAAKHVDADLVVHYGHACLSATARLPVIYVFTKQPLADVSAAAQSLVHQAKEHVLGNDGRMVKALVLTYDLAWDHVVEDVFVATKQALEEQGIQVPLLRTHVDFTRNYDDKLVHGQSAATAAATTATAITQAGCCGSSGVAAAGACACADAEALQGQGAPCCGGGSCSTADRSCSRTTVSSTAAADMASERLERPLGPSRSVTLPADTTYSECGYLYLGPESLSLTHLLLRLGPSTRMVSYDPLTSTSHVATGSTNRLLMKRYASVLKARDASVVGLLVGTLGVHSYLPLLHYLRGLLTSPSSRRKVYTISVGKLNPAKLANFQEIDVFVLVACPENSLVDSKHFFKPIVTPFEMQLAVKSMQRTEDGIDGGESVEWSGEYVLDLETLVPQEWKQGKKDLVANMGHLHVDDASNHQQQGKDEAEEEEADDDRPHFSLISGTYVHRRKFHQHTPSSRPLTSASNTTSEHALQLAHSSRAAGDTDSVVVRNPTTGQLTTVLETASIAHTTNRAWNGLQQRLGLDQPSQLEEGREGIAKGYKDAGGQGHVM